MLDFYVTFGDLLIDFYLHVRAKNIDIVRAYMQRKSKLGCWCRVVTERPQYTQPLRARSVDLFYEQPEHV